MTPPALAVDRLQVDGFVARQARFRATGSGDNGTVRLDGLRAYSLGGGFVAQN